MSSVYDSLTGDVVCSECNVKAGPDDLCWVCGEPYKAESDEGAEERDDDTEDTDDPPRPPPLLPMGRSLCGDRRWSAAMSARLPDPITSDDDAMDVYLRECHKAFLRADERHRTLSTEETRRERLHALQGLRQAELNVFGVVCPKCDGSGAHPALAFHIQCGLCQGEGAVMPNVARRYEEG